MSNTYYSIYDSHPTSIQKNIVVIELSSHINVYMYVNYVYMTNWPYIKVQILFTESCGHYESTFWLIQIVFSSQMEYVSWNCVSFFSSGHKFDFSC